MAFCTTLLKTVRVGTGNVFRMKDFQRTSFRHFRALVKRQKRRLSTVGCPEGEKLDHYLEFVSRAKANKIGREVKAADIKDNLDISRIDDITEGDINRLTRYKPR